jgi:hypothetical protein
MPRFRTGRWLWGSLWRFPSRLGRRLRMRQRRRGSGPGRFMQGPGRNRSLRARRLRSDEPTNEQGHAGHQCHDPGQDDQPPNPACASGPLRGHACASGPLTDRRRVRRKQDVFGTLRCQVGARKAGRRLPRPDQQPPDGHEHEGRNDCQRRESFGQSRRRGRRSGVLRSR